MHPYDGHAIQPQIFWGCGSCLDRRAELRTLIRIDRKILIAVVYARENAIRHSSRFGNCMVYI